MKKGTWKLVVAVILIAVLATVSVITLKDSLQLGLDLKGGAEVTLQAIAENGAAVTQEDMDQLKEVMSKRVNEFGVSEPIIQQEGDDRLIIQLAGVDNPDDAIAALGKTAKLEFVDPQGKTILSGSDLVDAQGVNYNGSAVISLKFSPEGAKKFADATTRNVGQQIAIVIDGQVVSAPRVDEPILNGEAQITGQYKLEEAVSQAALFRGGALPVDVEIMAKRTVGPLLGADSLHKSLIAGAIGLVLLLLFMIAYYRLPGVVAAVSLFAYGTILIWILHLAGVVLTLPGIAGFVLTIGMAVDANIIIYERLREELHAGKSLRAAIDAGFKRALWTILDSNITTLLAAAVLFYFGTGSIQGFAVTLSIGILVNMFSALVLTKHLLVWTSEVPAFRNNVKLYGGRGTK